MNALLLLLHGLAVTGLLNQKIGVSLDMRCSTQQLGSTAAKRFVNTTTTERSALTTVGGTTERGGASALQLTSAPPPSALHVADYNISRA